MDGWDRSGIAGPSRKLGFVFEHSMLGEFSCFSSVLDLGASWKIVLPLTGFSIRMDAWR
jgi:hypothetical protein